MFFFLSFLHIFMQHIRKSKLNKLTETKIFSESDRELFIKLSSLIQIENSVIEIVIILIDLI